jgi:hypothetical protein
LSAKIAPWQPASSSALDEQADRDREPQAVLQSFEDGKKRDGVGIADQDVSCDFANWWGIFYPIFWTITAPNTTFI